MAAKTAGSTYTGSKIVTGEVKPLHTERVRLKLPNITPPGKPEVPNTAKTHLSGNLATIKKLKALDPLKILEPFKKKLSIPESQKILEVIEDLIQKCDIILILPKLLGDVQAYRPVLGSELTSLLISHRGLLEQLNSDEKTYQTIYEKIHGPRTYNPRSLSRASIPESGSVRYFDQKKSSMSRKGVNSRADSRQETGSPESEAENRASSDSSHTSSLEAQLEMAAISFGRKYADVQHSIRNVLRGFRNKEGILKQLVTEIGGTRARESLYYMQCLNDLKEILLEKLLVTPDEQQEKQEYMAQINAQDRSNQQAIQNLEKDLSAAIEARDNEISAKNEQIKILQHNLRNLESATEDDIRRAKTESEKQIQADTRMSDSRKMKLDADLKQLRTALQTSVTEHRQDEQNMRKKKWKVESEIENWLQRYDSEMTEKQSEYEEIDAIYQEEKKQLIELENRFKLLEVEYNEIMQKRVALKLKRETAIRMLQIQTQAAIIIQAIWRAFRVRKALRLKEKQKKKKGKGKKKKT